jgi:single-stranded DNA-binding protein
MIIAIYVGRVTKEPEFTKVNEVPVAMVELVETRTSEGNEIKDYYIANLWGFKSEIKLKVGDLVCVTGRLKQTDWIQKTTNKPSINIDVDTIRVIK